MGNEKVYEFELTEGSGSVVRRVEVGDCVALRVAHEDGMLEDLVFGGTEEEQQAALGQLQNRRREPRAFGDARGAVVVPLGARSLIL